MIWRRRMISGYSRWGEVWCQRHARWGRKVTPLGRRSDACALFSEGAPCENNRFSDLAAADEDKSDNPPEPGDSEEEEEHTIQPTFSWSQKCVSSLKYRSDCP